MAADKEHRLLTAEFTKIVDPIWRNHRSEEVLPKIFNPLVEVNKMARILDQLEVSSPEFDIPGTMKVPV